MALFMKQDFSPPMLSKKWLLTKFRPNVLLYTREHIISILESGLLFREDSMEVEREAPSPDAVRGAAGAGVLTRGERAVAMGLLSAAIITCPPKSLNRSTLVYMAVYASIPMCVRLCHRSAARGSSLRQLLFIMRDYVALARRAQACLKECRTMHKELSSLKTVIESTLALLCRQQSELSVLMSRASSALLGNVPWVRSDVARDVIDRDLQEDLTKIHHTFLVVQSTLLKHIAMAHFIPSVNAQRLYKNHNERVYWIHTVLIEHLKKDFKENYEALERMYRLLKNYGNNDSVARKPGSAINDSWTYSEVHSGIAKANLELKIALSKCNSLDMFLDNCGINKHDVDLETLDKDIDDLIEKITGCLNTVQNSQLRLKKLKIKFGVKKERDKTVVDDVSQPLLEEEAGVLKIEDKEPETRDEVFYFVKTEDDFSDVQPAADLTTVPGKKEKETTKVVLNELRRKLVKREDLMRERERQALLNTMPELEGKVPEFPRQIDVSEAADKKGYITKLRKVNKKKLFNIYKIHSRQSKKPHNLKAIVKDRYYNIDNDIKNPDELLIDLKHRKKTLLTSETNSNRSLVLTKWHKNNLIETIQPAKPNKIALESNENEKKSNNIKNESSDYTESFSDGGSNAPIQVHNHNKKRINVKHDNSAKNFKFNKLDLEFSSSDDDFNESRTRQLLNDIRRHRVARKKNYPVKRGSISVEKDDEVDESLKPVHYSFGTGMAIASVLQVNNSAGFRNAVQEEIFAGDGEVSEDSGNDEDS